MQEHSLCKAIVVKMPRFSVIPSSPLMCAAIHPEEGERDDRPIPNEDEVDVHIQDRWGTRTSCFSKRRGCEGTTSPRKRPMRSGWVPLVQSPRTVLRGRQAPSTPFKQPVGSTDKDGAASSERQHALARLRAPEYRLMQQDDPAPPRPAPAWIHPTLSSAPLVTRVRHLVGLLPRWQLTPKRDQCPVRRHGHGVDPPDPDPAVVAGRRTGGEPSVPGRPPLIPTKRKREVTRRVRKALPEPTPANWIMVAPGRYIRGEEPAPEMVASSSPVEEGAAG